MDKFQKIREAAEADLEVFIKLVAPERLLGSCHKEVIDWWTRPGAKDHQLLLFPRDHMKSALIAYRVAWELAKDPTLRILYISATSNLAEKQLGFIKNILTSSTFRRYWPNHVEEEEGKRAKWTNTEIELDHPARKVENIRDPSVFTAGLTTSITGMHCDIAVLDDVVVQENAYSEDGRRKVRLQYSLLSSIESGNAKEWAVGTRYHPKDLYQDLMEMVEDIFDSSGSIVSQEPIYEVMQREVEKDEEFLWPRQLRKDGKWFGFDQAILAKKRGKYLDKSQFYAQYYNDPNDPDNSPTRNFQYYNKSLLVLRGSDWFYRDKKLNLTAAIDFAYSTRKRADFTAIVVIGIDEDNNIFVLDIDRFKTTDIKEYYNRLFKLYNIWGFTKLVAETSVAQAAIVKSLKEDHLRPAGIFMSIEEVKPTRHEGTKEERMDAILTPRYENGAIFHYRGGNTQVLEEELSSYNPQHDDVKDALSNAIAFAKKPSKSSYSKKRSVKYHPKYGGRIRA